MADKKKQRWEGVKYPGGGLEIYDEDGKYVAGFDDGNDGRLVLAAVNACKSVNPSNPMAVAKELTSFVSVFKRLREWQQVSKDIMASEDPIFLKNANRLEDDSDNVLAAITKPANGEEK